MSDHCTLILFSGGLDSTSCLFKLLEQTNDDIHTFYIDIDNNNIKNWCENHSRKYLLKEARKHFRDVMDYNDCKTTVSGKVNGGLSQPPVWILNAAFKLTEIWAKRKPKRLCLGYTRGDDASKEIRNINTMWKNIWNIINTQEKPPELYFPVINSTKDNSVRFLKRIQKKYDFSILDKIWVCENSTFVHSSSFSGYKPCNECVPCIKFKKLSIN